MAKPEDGFCAVRVRCAMLDRVNEMRALVSLLSVEEAFGALRAAGYGIVAGEEDVDKGLVVLESNGDDLKAGRDIGGDAGLDIDVRHGRRGDDRCVSKKFHAG